MEKPDYNLLEDSIGKYLAAKQDLEKVENQRPKRTKVFGLSPFMFLILLSLFYFLGKRYIFNNSINYENEITTNVEIKSLPIASNYTLFEKPDDKSQILFEDTSSVAVTILDETNYYYKVEFSKNFKKHNGYIKKRNVFIEENNNSNHNKNEKSNLKKDRKEVETVVSNNSQANLNLLKVEALRLKGGREISRVKLTGSTASILYVSNYEEYKELQPQSNLTAEMFYLYWVTGDKLKKNLVEIPVNLMRKLDFLNKVELTLPRNKKTYFISVEKSQLEKFINKDFQEIINDWTNTFYDPYVYTKENRDRFFEKFCTVK